MEKLVRCSWCNVNNSLYVKYHDEEWGKLRLDDNYLFEMLILESFQAGLSWECVLNKRESFRDAYDDFDLDKVCKYGDLKVEELLVNRGIIRNRLKVLASISNAKIFKNIILEYGSFANFLRVFTNGDIFYEIGQTRSLLSDAVSLELQRRGMKYVGSTIIYSYLQAVGIINSHDVSCYLYEKKAS